LVSSGSLVTAVGAFAFHEPVGQKALIVLAVQHLCFLGENIAVLVNFHQEFLYEFFVHWAFGSGVIVE
jgi:hypothetical protein